MMKKSAVIWKGIALALLLAAPGLASAEPQGVDEAVPVEVSAADHESAAVEDASGTEAPTLDGAQGAPELEPAWLAADVTTAGLNACFPPSPPPESCVCGSCCDCNKCWRNGVLVRMLCDY